MHLSRSSLSSLYLSYNSLLAILCVCILLEITLTDRLLYLHTHTYIHCTYYIMYKILCLIKLLMILGGKKIVRAQILKVEKACWYFGVQVFWRDIASGLELLPLHVSTPPRTVFPLYPYSKRTICTLLDQCDASCTDRVLSKSRFNLQSYIHI